MIDRIAYVASISSRALMAASLASEEPLSLLWITVRRTITVGRAGLIYGTGVSLFLTIILGISSPNGLTAGVPIFLPIFATAGSLGGLTVFTSDRLKGVLEYLMAYGISPRRLFANILVASLVSATIVLVIATAVGTAIFFIQGYASNTFFLLLAFYALPMTYASAAFVAIVGMYWTALSSPRQGMNSLIGIAPFIGILPSIATLGTTVALGVAGVDITGSSFIIVTSIAVALLGALYSCS